ncbi:MAG: hypothetical protein ACTSRW_12320 [Candidatus Helarchaeota archaeon]
MGLTWSFKFKSREEKDRWFEHAKQRNRTLAGLIRELMEFEMAGYNPLNNFNNSNTELIELLQKKIELLESNLTELIKMKFNQFLLFQKLGNLNAAELEKFIIEKLETSKSFYEIQEEFHVEPDILLKILDKLMDEGKVSQNWTTQKYKRLKE